MTIEDANEKERLRQIAKIAEMDAFGPGANPFRAHLMFELQLNPDEARAVAIAVRAALTEIGVPGFKPLVDGGHDARA